MMSLDLAPLSAVPPDTRRHRFSPRSLGLALDLGVLEVGEMSGPSTAPHALSGEPLSPPPDAIDIASLLALGTQWRRSSHASGELRNG